MLLSSRRPFLLCLVLIPFIERKPRGKNGPLIHKADPVLPPSATTVFQLVSEDLRERETSRLMIYIHLKSNNKQLHTLSSPFLFTLFPSQIRTGREKKALTSQPTS